LICGARTLRVWWRDMTDPKQIAKEIVKQIKRVKPAADVGEQEILDRIDTARRKNQSFGSRKRNKEYAKEALDWVKAGQRLLTPRQDTMPPGMLFLNFSAFKIAEQHEVFTDEEKHRPTLEMILTRMQQQCEILINSEIGDHGNAGRLQLQAAYAAIWLMDQYGLPVTYSSETAVYRTVARLLFEAMTGQTSEDGADIARACKKAALERNAELKFEIDLALKQANDETETDS
jgi:hypothetical protein